MDDKIKINLQMANMYFPLTILRKDEEIVRKAAKNVDKLISVYRERYSENITDTQAAIMVAYQLSLDNLKNEQRNDTAPYREKIEELTTVLENHLSKE